MIVGVVEAALVGLIVASLVLASAAAAGWVSAGHAVLVIVAVGVLSGALRAAQHRTGVTTLAPIESPEEGT